MEERAHPKYIIGTYEGEGIKIHASAYTKQQLIEELKKLLWGGEISPGRFVVLRPMEGVVASLDPTIEISIDED